MSNERSKNAPAKVEPPADPAGALARLVEEFGPGALAKLDDMGRAFKVAEGVKKVRALVLQAAERIMPLQGTPLGFKTDKDREGGYPPAVVAECATEALLRGLRLTGNEWNIIGGRCYVAQAGCARLVAEIPGLTDLEHAPGIPVMKDGGAIVEYTVSWKLDGKPMSLTRKIPVRVNSGMGVDAILGKAKRKILAAVYERVTGSTLSDGDTDDQPLAPQLPKPGQLAERIRDRLGPAPGEPAKPPVEVKAREVDQFGNPLDLGEPEAPAAGSLFGDPQQKLPD